MHLWGIERACGVLRRNNETDVYVLYITQRNAVTTRGTKAQCKVSEWISEAKRLELVVERPLTKIRLGR